MQRDQFLTEWLGECWHEWDGIRLLGGPIMTCHKCKHTMAGWEPEDFGTWLGFGKLWEAAQIDEEWARFLYSFYGQAPDRLKLTELINPNRFATAWAKFKGWKEDNDALV
jgi:hypothetical protein